MRGTNWPMLQRARRAGVLYETDTAPLKVDPRQVIPINVQYSSDTFPRLKEEHSREEYGDRTRKAFANTRIRPPFPTVWYEWREQPDPARPNTTWADCYAMSYLIGNTVTIIAGWDEIGVGKAGEYVPAFCRTSLDLALFSDESLVNNDDFYTNGVPVVTSSVAQLAVDTSPGVTLQDLVEEGATSIFTVLWSWLLLSCNNVDVEETQPFHRGRKAQKDPNRVVFRELVVSVPPGKRFVSESFGEDEGVAFHVRRGHFADYTKGKGLFGKYHGKYWVPATTVGDPDYGTVIKSYKLEGAEK